VGLQRIQELSNLIKKAKGIVGYEFYVQYFEELNSILQKAGNDSHWVKPLSAKVRDVIAYSIPTNWFLDSAISAYRRHFSPGSTDFIDELVAVLKQGRPLPLFWRQIVTEELQRIFTLFDEAISLMVKGANIYLHDVRVLKNFHCSCDALITELETCQENFARFMIVNYPHIEQYADLKKGPLIGRGGFGAVYKSTLRQRPSEFFAIKEIPLADSQVLAVSELHIMMNLNHSNIVKFWGSCLNDNTLYIIMELAEKGDLYNFMKEKMNQGKWTSTLICKIALDIAQGMHHMHQLNLVHRDLKPSNILIDANGVAKISDMGLACSATALKTLCGTAMFAAPEILEGATYTSAVDVYSYSLILYIMFYGKDPFTSEQLPKVWNGWRPTFEATQATQPLVKLIQDCWKHSYSDRPSFGDIVDRLKGL